MPSVKERLKSAGKAVKGAAASVKQAVLHPKDTLKLQKYKKLQSEYKKITERLSAIVKSLNIALNEEKSMHKDYSKRIANLSSEFTKFQNISKEINNCEKFLPTDKHAEIPDHLGGAGDGFYPDTVPTKYTEFLAMNAVNKLKFLLTTDKYKTIFNKYFNNVAINSEDTFKNFFKQEAPESKKEILAFAREFRRLDDKYQWRKYATAVSEYLQDKNLLNRAKCYAGFKECIDIIFDVASAGARKEYDDKNKVTLRKGKDDSGAKLAYEKKVADTVKKLNNYDGVTLTNGIYSVLENNNDTVLTNYKKCFGLEKRKEKSSATQRHCDKVSTEYTKWTKSCNTFKQKYISIALNNTADNMENAGRKDIDTITGGIVLALDELVCKRISKLADVFKIGEAKLPLSQRATINAKEVRKANEDFINRIKNVAKDKLLENLGTARFKDCLFKDEIVNKD